MILYSIGANLSEQCVSIDECKACWSLIKKEITSELCQTSNKRCIAEPYKMQHNALVDVILCACNKARKIDYTNLNMNKRIIEVYSQMSCPRQSLNCNMDISVKDICERGLLVKWKY